MRSKRVRALFRRRPNTHKGDFGHVLIVAGSLKYSGAGVLASMAALRSGAGLVTLGIPKGISRPLVEIKPKEVMLLPLAETHENTISALAYPQIKAFTKSVDVLVVGPGLSQNKSTQELVRRVVAKIDLPMVIDADGLNALVGHLDALRVTSYASRAPKILTPHPGEMARLLGISVKKVQAKRKETAKDFTKKYKVITVLKGHQTVVASPEGKIYINRTGNPGMATAGSGDVLTGMIAAFLGQGLNAFDAARYAVYLHGLAGDLAAKKKTQISLIASDIIDNLPEAFKKFS